VDAVLPPTPSVLVGYSLGARVAMAATHFAPTRVRGALLISGHPGLASPAQRAERAAVEARWQARLANEPLHTFMDAWERQPLFATQQNLDAELLAEQRRWRTAHRSEGLLLCHRALALSTMPDWRPSLAAFAGPVVVLTGALDGAYTSLGAELLALGAHIQHRVVPGVGHNVLLEAPQVVGAAARELMAAVEACEAGHHFNAGVPTHGERDF
jgi:2-succinyl-6-hydroxy-2,4-cyclohexadiene-1-carboxylate synthase